MKVKLKAFLVAVIVATTVFFTSWLLIKNLFEDLSKTSSDDDDDPDQDDPEPEKPAPVKGNEDFETVSDLVDRELSEIPEIDRVAEEETSS